MFRVREKTLVFGCGLFFWGRLCQGYFCVAEWNPKTDHESKIKVRPSQKLLKGDGRRDVVVEFPPEILFLHYSVLCVSFLASPEEEHWMKCMEELEKMRKTMVKADTKMAFIIVVKGSDQAMAELPLLPDHFSYVPENCAVKTIKDLQL